MDIEEKAAFENFLNGKVTFINDKEFCVDRIVML